MSTVPSNSLVLGIETSCDETAAAVVAGGTDVRSSIVSSQIDLHAEFGGVVPEIAGRAHVELLIPVVADALVEAGVVGADIEAVAATVGPGLVGALLVGVSAAKALALVWDVPFVGVNHLEAHLYAALLEDPDLEPPLVFLLVSGGHTLIVVMEGHGHYRVVGSTVDDAAGEAFDKVARYLGFGYPGGPIIDRLAKDGDPSAIAFPRAMADQGLDFSFSGLKTAVVNHVRKHPDVAAEDVAASFQEAVVDVLVAKVRKAADEVGAKGLALGGGVAANSRLREAFLAATADDGRPGYVPSRAMCTDNAAMVASCGWYRWKADGGSPLDLGADPGLRLG
ncbi:MAG: tRNA (adenosine(37)-N6)-threonylcarbamoyltransferase complex transferase subunit TsaD [Acidimicrobiales bacterium]